MVFAFSELFLFAESTVRCEWATNNCFGLSVASFPWTSPRRLTTWSRRLCNDTFSIFLKEKWSNHLSEDDFIHLPGKKNSFSRRRTVLARKWVHFYCPSRPTALGVQWIITFWWIGVTAITDKAFKVKHILVTSSRRPSHEDSTTAIET